MGRYMKFPLTIEQHNTKSKFTDFNANGRIYWTSCRVLNCFTCKHTYCMLQIDVTVMFQTKWRKWKRAEQNKTGKDHCDQGKVILQVRAAKLNFLALKLTTGIPGIRGSPNTGLVIIIIPRSVPVLGPGFSGGANSRGGTLPVILQNLLSKTAWKWKNPDRGRRNCLHASLKLIE